MSQTRDQQRFTISEVAADWHEQVVPQGIMYIMYVHNVMVDPGWGSEFPTGGCPPAPPAQALYRTVDNDHAAT